MMVSTKKRLHLFVDCKETKTYVNSFRGTTLLHPIRMPFRCYHILTLSREFPFATILSFHGNRSTVSSANFLLCLAPTGNSLEVKNLLTIPHHRVYDVPLYHMIFGLSIGFLKKVQNRTKKCKIAILIIYFEIDFFDRYYLNHSLD